MACQAPGGDRPGEVEVFVDFKAQPVLEAEPRDSSSCHSLSRDDACGKRSVTGTGSASPSRRATSTAAASTNAESRPPEKATVQGARMRYGRTASASASRGLAAAPRSSPRRVGSEPYIQPDSRSSEVSSRSAAGPSLASDVAPVERGPRNVWPVNGSADASATPHGSTAIPSLHGDPLPLSVQDPAEQLALDDDRATSGGMTTAGRTVTDVLGCPEDISARHQSSRDRLIRAVARQAVGAAYASPVCHLGDAPEAREPRRLIRSARARLVGG